MHAVGLKTIVVVIVPTKTRMWQVKLSHQQIMN